MNSLFHFIQNHFPFLIDYKYTFLFLGALIEGFNSLILGGFLASLKAVKFLPLWALMVIGHSLNGYFWYFVGYHGGARALDKWGHKRKISHDILTKLSSYFNKYSGKVILFSKLTWGFEIAVLILSGAFKYNLKSFSKYNFAGSLFWVSFAMGVGYGLGRGFSLVSFRFHFLIIFLAGAIAIAFFIAKFIQTMFVKSVNIQEKFEKLKNNWKDKKGDNNID